MIENHLTEEVKIPLSKRIFSKKNVDNLIENSKKNGLKKSLSTFDLTMLGIGAIIGAGIFTLAGTAAVGTPDHPGAGPGLILSFILSGFACTLSALCYAEFAAMIPVSGSVYTYTYTALGEVFAWLIGWILMLEYLISCIAVADGWSGYLMELLKGFNKFLPNWLVDPPLWLIYDYNTAVQKYHDLGLNPNTIIPHLGSLHFSINLPAVFIVLVITSFLFVGIKESTRMASIMVAIKMAVILLFIGVGAFYVKPTNWVPFLPNGLQGVASGAFLVFFAYIGFDAISTAAEETKNPQKSLPISIITSLSICTLLYIAVAAVLTGMVRWDQIDTYAPVAAAMIYVKHNTIAGIISLGAIAGLTSVILVMELGTTRILFAMSRDKLLPSIISKVHPKFGTPHVITIIAGIFIIIGTMFLDIKQAAKLCNIGTLSAFLIICLEVLILRVTDPNRERPFKVPCAPVTASLGIIVCAVVIIFGVPADTIKLFVGWVSLGILIYVAYGLYRSSKLECITKSYEIPVIKEELVETEQV